MDIIRNIIRFISAKIRNGRKVSFDFTVSISLSSKFEGANRIYSNSFFCGYLGYGSYIGQNCYIIANIGKFTSIAPNVKINLGAHPYKYPYATTCPMFYSTRKQNGHTFAKRNMFNEVKNIPTIGNDCWVGQNVFIAGGITISDGAVVLAGAVVVQDVPPYAIVGGVPAKILDYRYDQETINFLQVLKWWEKDISWLKGNWELLSDISKLREVCVNENTNRADNF